MTRLLIFSFILNALLPSMGLTAMVSDMGHTMSQTGQHSVVVMVVSPDSISMLKSPDRMNLMDSAHCDEENTQNTFCEVKCATTCAQIPVLSSKSILLPIPLYSSDSVTAFAYFYTRSISPELRPPLV
jgi:hypothetical protein